MICICIALYFNVLSSFKVLVDYFGAFLIKVMACKMFPTKEPMYPKQSPKSLPFSYGSIPLVQDNSIPMLPKMLLS